MVEDFKMYFVYMYPKGEANKDAFPIQSMTELGISNSVPLIKCRVDAFFPHEAIFYILIQIK